MLNCDNHDNICTFKFLLVIDFKFFYMILDFVHVTDLLSKYGISDSVMLMAGKFQSHIDISSKSRSIL